MNAVLLTLYLLCPFALRNVYADFSLILSDQEDQKIGLIVSVLESQYGFVVDAMGATFEGAMSAARSVLKLAH